MRDVVVDACVAVKWFVAETDSEMAQSLFQSDVRRSAPDFILVELANAFWKNGRLKRMTPDQLVSAQGLAKRFFWSLPPATKLIDDALDLARLIDHPVFDCLYVVASRQMNAELVTTDTKLVAKLAGTPDADRVVLLADWK